MTNITGALGSYTFTFTTEAANPAEFMEDFTAGNIEKATITENHVQLINKQGKEITVDLSEFGLVTLEHLDEEKNETEKFSPQGM